MGLNILASYVVYTRLYSSKKYRGIYDVIIVCIVHMFKANHSIETFNNIELKNLLAKYYGFDGIPLVVIDAIIYKMLDERQIIRFDRDNNTYKVVHGSNDDQDSINNLFNNTLNDYNDFAFKIKNYLLTKHNYKISDKEIMEQLYNILLNDGIVVTNNIVLSYLKELCGDKKYENLIQQILTGNLLFAGLKENLGGINEPKDYIYIYLDTEILFFLYGFDSKLSQLYARDLLDCISKINRNNKIKLRYFLQTRYDIDTFFNQAIRIKDNNEMLDPTKTAMVKIVNQCQNSEEIIELRSKFFSFLKRKYNICEDEYSECLNISDNQKYFIANEDFVTTIEINSDDKTNIIKFINQINILRQGNNNLSILSTKAFFITKTRSFVNISREVERINSVGTKFVFNYNNFCNILWTISNKSLSTERVPQNINIINYLNCLFLDKTEKSLIDAFEKAKREYNNNELSKEEMILQMKYIEDTLVKLEEKDDFSNEEMDEYLKIDAEFVNSKGQELSIVNEENKELKGYNSELKVQLKERDKQIEDMNIQLDYYKNKEQNRLFNRFKSKVLGLYISSKNIPLKLKLIAIFIIIIVIMLVLEYVFHFELARNILDFFKIIKQHVPFI